MFDKLQRKLNFYPLFKFAKNKGDRIWYITAKQGAKVYIPFGFCVAKDSKQYPDISLYKFYLGPFVFGFGRFTK